MAKLKQKQQRTQAVQGCNKNVPIRSTAPIVVPGCTFEFDSDAEVERYFNAGEGYLYSRSENPTVDQAAEEIAALEGAPAAAMFASGMAAISTAVLALAGKGGRVLCQREVYGGSAELMQEWLPRWGFEVQWIDREALNALEPKQLDGISLLYLETPTNPTLRLVDLEHIGKTARAAGVPTLVDSTFASPIVQRPLEFGIDLVMHSTTKYLGGHSDLLGGVICGDATLLQEVHSHRRILGGVMDAFSAFLLMRGLRTLPIRIAAHQESAAKIAEFLQQHDDVIDVAYPGLKQHPDHALATKQMTGFGGMVSFRVAGGEARALKLHDNVELFKRAGSLGSVESLLSIPTRMSHRHVDDAERQRAGVTPDLIRLSVGLEAADDLIADLAQALDASA